MLSDIYNDRILNLAGNIPRLGRLAAPDATATAHSKLCGSTVTVDLVLDAGIVTDFAHEVRACALGQASSSIMARHVVGARVEDLRALRDTVRRMLKENGAPPGGPWAEVRGARAHSGLQGASRLDASDLRRRLRCHRSDRVVILVTGCRASPVTRLVAHLLIRAYQLTVSGAMGRQCRYLPTCSEYMDDAIRRHGLWMGGWMGTARLCRCHPWGGSGYDPVGETPPTGHWTRPWRYGQWRQPPAPFKSGPAVPP